MNQAYRLIPLLLSLVVAVPATLTAAPTAEEIIEQARARSRDIEELKKLLNGPDQNMRLTTFEAMVTSDDEVMRSVATEIGLASADSLMQALAFKHAVLALDRIHMTLTPSTDTPKKVQEASAAYIAAQGGDYVLKFQGKDLGSGTITLGGSAMYKAQVSGTLFTFLHGNDSGSFELQNDNSIKGTIQAVHRGTPVHFVATGRIR